MEEVHYGSEGPHWAGVPMKKHIVRVIQSRRFRWESHVARMEESRSAFKILTGTPAGKRPVGRPRHRWENNIKIDLQKVGIDVKNYIDSAQNTDYCRALVNAGLNLQIPYAMMLCS